MRKKNKVTLICLNCNNPFLCVERDKDKRKFCSPKCAAVYNGKNGKIGGDVNSLDKFIGYYGIEEGKKRYKAKSDKISVYIHKNRGGINNPNYGRVTNSLTKKRIRSSVKDSEYHRDIKGKGFDEIWGDGARDKLSEKMKGTFTINWFIDKYGREVGIKKYKERCAKISDNNGFREYNKMNKNNYSKISQTLFWEVYNQISCLKNERVYFAELNHECSCGLYSRNFDFVILDRRKIIEFNGDIFHANPNMFKEFDCPNPYDNTMTSSIIWEKDKKKIESIVSKGYDVLIVWEDEYNTDKSGVINKCIAFVEDK
jgi:very-short-patch-repair endonuclease